MKLFKKLTTFALIVILVLTSIPHSVFAAETIIDKDALRVSDEFAEQYPNGYIEFATTYFEATEGDEDFDVIVARRGGTKGKVNVNFKVIENSAKYGEDFVILLPEKSDFIELEKSVDTPTIMESNILDENEQVITSNRNLNRDPQENKNITDVEDLKENKTYEDIDYKELVAEKTEEKDNIDTDGDIQYKSELHRERDEYLNTVSSYEEPTSYTDDMFNIDDQMNIDLGEAVNIILPGASGTLTFEDGENYKTFRIHIIDDDIYETPEQFTIGLYEPDGGAVLGEHFNTGCTIKDNDPEEDYIIEFENSKNIAVCTQDSIKLKIVKMGSLNAITDAEISTRGITALPDKHYTPVINTAVFMPGETEKYIEIPLLDSNIEKPLDFEVILTENSRGMIGKSEALVTIQPAITASKYLDGYTAENNTDEDAFDSIEARTAYSYNDRIILTPSSFGNSWGNATRHGEIQWSLITKGGPTENTGMKGTFDLRGIESVSADWRFQASSTTNKHAQARVTISNKSDAWEKRFDWRTENLTSWSAFNGFSRCSNAVISFEAHRGWGRESNVFVRDVTLYKQKFSIEQIQADKLTYYNYTNNGSKVSAGTYLPGSIETSKTSLYRDESFNVSEMIDSRNTDKGSYLKGFYPCYYNGAAMGKLFTDKTITVTPAFIESYIYSSSRSQTEKKLRIKPVYDRLNAENIIVNEYDRSAGVLKFAGKNYYGKDKISISGAKIGDTFTPAFTPNNGYTFKGFTVYNQNTGKITQYGPGKAIPFTANSKLEVNVTPSDNNVRIMWKAPSVGTTEDISINRGRGKIYHDQWDKMPVAEKNVLFKNVNYQESYKSPEVPTSNMSESERNKYEKELEVYRKKIQDRSDKIDANYMSYMNSFNTYSIEKASIGEVITLYAKPSPGYTVRWYTNIYETAGKDLPESELMKVQPHYGTSFTFTVTEDLQYVYYYFEENTSLDNQVFKGRVITGYNTIKQQTAFDINLKNPNTFRGVEGVQVSVATTGNDKTSYTDKNGKTYYTNATTDKDGEFSLFVPNAAKGVPFSFKLSNGVKVYGKSGMIDNKVVYVLPFMDEYRVTSMGISDMRATDIKIVPTDEQRTIYINTDTEENRAIQKVVLRSYDADGAMWKALEATEDVSEENRWSIKTNFLESFKNGGRLTVELYDERNLGHGEIECGYSIEIPPSPGNVNFPQQAPIGAGADLEVVGNANPSLDLGTEYDMTPEAGTDDKTYTIAIKTGKVLKQVIEDNVDNLESKTSKEKVTVLINYLCGNYTNLKNSTWKSKPAAEAPAGSVTRPPEGEAATGKAKTGSGKAALNIDFDFGYYLQMSRSNSGGKSTYNFDYSVLFLAGEINFKTSYNFNISGVPLYISFAAGGEIKGLVLADGRNDVTVGETANGWMPSMGTEGVDWVSVIQGDIYISLGAGLGARGLLSFGVSGRMDFGFQYQYADDGISKTGSEGAGTITFGLNIDIDLLFIPISIRVLESKISLFETDNYVSNAWLTTSSYRAINKAVNEAEVIAGNSKRTVGKNEWKGDDVLFQAIPGILVNSKTLQKDGLNNQSPLMIDYEDSHGETKQLVLFLDDDNSRNNYNYSALSYSVQTDTQLDLWSEPKIVYNNNTFDSAPTALDVGDSILVMWPTSKESYDTEPKMSDMMNNNEIFISYFDKELESFTEATKLTNNDYANASPSAFIDEDGKIVVSYIITDYKTDDMELDLDDLTQDNINKFLNGAYSTIGYTIIDGNNFEHGFVNIDLPSKNTPFITELTSSSFKNLDNEEIGVIAYCFDEDNDLSTEEDQEIYIATYNFKEDGWSNAIPITVNETKDASPKLIKNEDEILLFWNADGYVNTLELSKCLNYGFDSAVIRPVFEEKNLEMSNTFFPHVGKDGNIYLVWTEDYSYIEKINENDEKTNPENTTQTTGRGIYFAMYDSKYRLASYDNEDEAYVGQWGLPYRISIADGRLSDNPIIFVDEEGRVSVLSLESDLLQIEGDENTYLQKAVTSDLVLREYRNATSLSVLEITTEPEYPNPNEEFIININIKNSGSIPSEGITTIADVYRNGTHIEEESTEFETTMYHFSSSEEITLSYQMTLTETENTRLDFKIYEDDLSDSAKEISYDINYGTMLGDPDARVSFYNENSLVVNALIHNLGNVDAKDLSFVMEEAGVPESDENGEPIDNVVREKYADFPVETIEKGNIYPFEFIFDIPEKIIEDGYAEVRLSIRDSEDVEIFYMPLNANKPKIKESEILGLLVDDKNSDVASIKMHVGSMKQLSAALYPIEASMIHSLLFESSDTDIFEIDGLTGFIKANSAGIANLKVTALNSDNICMQLEDDTFLDPDGNVVKFSDEDGSIINSLEPSDSTVVRVFEIPVYVTNKGSKPNFVIESSSNSGGYIYPNDTDTVSFGDSREYRVVPDEGYKIADIIVDGKSIGTMAAYELINITENHTFEAVFEKRNNFEDVASGVWSEEYIYFLTDRGIIDGVGKNKFAPKNSTTRAEFVKMIANMNGIDKSLYKDKIFEDVDSKAWYAPYIQWAYEKEIINGTSTTKFSPYKEISRQDAAVILQRYVNYRNTSLPEVVDKIVFEDDTDISAYAKDAVSNLQMADIINGIKKQDKKTYFIPQKNAIREESAKMIANIYKIMFENDMKK